MTAPLSHPLIAVANSADWILDRLTEARGVLADRPRHPDSLVILAARIVAGQTDDAGECAEASDLLRLLDRRPLDAVAAAAFPKGGAA
jgi:hypothetical protein